MGASDRIVRHLRLRADSESGVHRAVLQLEDALRCASLPDVDRRVLLVRRLNLGRIPAGASSQTLSLLLEKRVAEVSGAWTHGIDPAAADAQYVFFRDALEARCQLGLQLAKGMACTTWYWPLAVSEFKPAEGARANLRSIALAIAALPEASVALPAWIVRLMDAGVAAVFANAIGTVDAALLLRAAHLVANPSRLPEIHLALPAKHHSESHEQGAEQTKAISHQEVSPAFTALPIWLQALALAGGFVPELVSVAAPADSVSASQDLPAHDTDGLIHARVGTTRRDDGLSPTASPDNDVQVAGESTQPRSGEPENATAPKVTDSPLAEAAPLFGNPYPESAPSALGGLLFLLAVLQRLGYPAWAEDLPDGAAAQVVRRMLGLVLLRLRASPDDPAWLFTKCAVDDEFGNIEIEIPTIWNASELASPRGSSLKNIAAPLLQAQSTTVLAQRWLIACRRWLRRVAGLGVASLVVRPASIGLTATHADVFFRLSDVDMRVRHAGLDFDPGWLPWYGRVITFHYRYGDFA